MCMAQDQFSIEILDEEANLILDKDADFHVLADGFLWSEGPLYVADGDYLLVSDIPRNKVFRIDSKGQVSDYLSPSGFLGKNFQGEEPGSNGLLLNDHGQLVLMQHGERRVAVMKAPLDHPLPEYEVIVDQYNGHRFNSPNDGVFDQNGNLYFTDPIYGLPGRAEDPRRELDFCGVFCLKSSGELILLDTLTRPNGIALSPDGKKLYVAVSDPNHAVWYHYKIVRAGKVKKKRMLYDASHLVGQEGQQGLPDGMEMHSMGFLFASGPGGLWVFNPDGKVVARIHTGKLTSNCTFSDDEKTLFITADDIVLTMELR